MKKLICFLLFCCLCYTLATAQQNETTRDIELTIVVDSANYHFEYDDDSSGYFIVPYEIDWTPGEPAIPWYVCRISIEDNEAFDRLEYSFTATTVAEDFYLAPVPNVVPISSNGAAGTSKAYPNEVYPDENVWYIATLPFAPKEIWLRIYPFRYYAHERVLKKLEIHVRLTVKVFTDGMNVLFPHLDNNKSVNGKFYDLTGRRLAAPPKKGVYIENGRKKVGR